MTNITIGQYYPAKSHIHSLDPRIKFLATVLYVATLFFANGIGSVAVVGLMLMPIIIASRVPVKFLFRTIKTVMIFIILTVTINLFFTPGENVLVKFWIITITAEGLILAVKMALRLMFLVSASSLLTLTTSPLELTYALEFILKPFKAIGVPAHEIAMMMTIALRFIPTLLEETEKIMKAQTARGADFNTGGLIKKAKAMLPLLVPLFVSAFRRADDLAMAMEARCYRGDIGRTRLKVMKTTPKDYVAIMYILCISLAVFTLNFFGM